MQRLGRRHKEPIGITRARESRRRIAQVHQGDRHVRDPREGAGEVFVERADERGRHVRRQGQHDRPRRQRPPLAAFLHHDVEIDAVHFDPPHPAIEVKIVAKMRGQRGGQLVEAIAKRGQPRRGLPPRLGEFRAHGQEEAAPLPLHGRDQGKGRRQTDLLGLPGVEAGDQRFEQPLARQRA